MAVASSGLRTSSTCPDQMEVDARVTLARMPEIAHRWREVQGSKDWSGMLEPSMDEALRQEIIRYGELSQVCYDGFDSDRESQHYGRCKFHRAHLFQQMGMGDCGYEVTKYLYATSQSPLDAFAAGFLGNHNINETWVGYVAVCTSEDEITRLGRRDIVVVWRGTVTSAEWVADFRDLQVPALLKLHYKPATAADPQQRLLRGATSISSKEEEHLEKAQGVLGAPTPPANVEYYADVQAEIGFLSLYTDEASARLASAKDQLRQEIGRLMERYKDDACTGHISITVTGHSLGGALATISAYDLALAGANRAVNMADHQHSPVAPVTAFTFGSPRVGNRAFKNHFDALGVKMLRVVNKHDIVPKVPGVVANELSNPLISRLLLDNLPLTYVHVGTELLLDSQRSPYLKPTTNPQFLHNLEVYLHLVDGRMVDSMFLPQGRDLALVNKYTSFLLDSCRIPSNWWQESNKGMHKNAMGMWVVRDSPTSPWDD